MFLFSNLPKPFRDAEHRWALKIEVCEVNSERIVQDWTALVSREKLCECVAEENGWIQTEWKGNMLWSSVECASSLTPSGELWEMGVCKHSPENSRTTTSLYLLGAHCFLIAFHWFHMWLQSKLLKKKILHSAMANVLFAYNIVKCTSWSKCVLSQ